MPKLYTVTVLIPGDSVPKSIRDAKPHETNRSGVPMGAKVMRTFILCNTEPGQHYSQGKARDVERLLKLAEPNWQISILDAPSVH